MAAPKGKKKLDELFDEIIVDISEKGESAISALKGRMSTQTFFNLLNDEEKSKRYARAAELRAERMADEIIIIADGKNLNSNRDRLRVDSRKWLLAKLHPKKYGEKVDVTSGDKPIRAPVIIIKDFTKNE